MKFTKTARRRVALVAASTAGALLFAGCSAGSLGSSDAGGQAGATEITFLTGATDNEVAGAKAVIEAFQAANPNITIKHDTRPGVRRVTTW
jgi:raffinose/stachyose/melibiose transport system substrate-binding protein